MWDGESVPREHDDSNNLGYRLDLILRIASPCQASDQAFRDDATAAARWQAFTSLKHERLLLSTTDTLQALFTFIASIVMSWDT